MMKGNSRAAHDIPLAGHQGLAMHEEPITLHATRISGGATNEDVSLGKVPEGVEYELRHIAAEDETTACTSLRLGIARGGVFSPLEEQKSPVAATLYHSEDPWYLRPGEELVARFNGSTSADVLQVYANGIVRRTEG